MEGKKELNTNMDVSSQVKITESYIAKLLSTADTLEKILETRDRTKDYHQYLQVVDSEASLNHILVIIYNAFHQIIQIETKDDYEQNEELFKDLIEVESIIERMVQSYKRLIPSYRTIYSYYDQLFRLEETTRNISKHLKLSELEDADNTTRVSNIQTLNEDADNKSLYFNSHERFMKSEELLESLVNQMENLYKLIEHKILVNEPSENNEEITLKQRQEPTLESEKIQKESMNKSNESPLSIKKYDSDEKKDRSKVKLMTKSNRDNLLLEQEKQPVQEEKSRKDLLEKGNSKVKLTKSFNGKQTESLLKDINKVSSSEINYGTKSIREMKSEGLFWSLIKPKYALLGRTNLNYGMILILLFSVIVATGFYLLIPSEERGFYLGPGNMSIFFGGVLLSWILSGISICTIYFSHRIIGEKLELSRAINYFGLYSFIAILLSVLTTTLFFWELYYYGSITILISFIYLFILIPFYIVIKLIVKERDFVEGIKLSVTSLLVHFGLIIGFYFLIRGAMLGNLLEKVYFILTI